MNEALHLSEKERHIILDCLAKIEFELQQTIDKHSKKLIAANIDLFLNYCDVFTTASLSPEKTPIKEF